MAIRPSNLEIWMVRWMGWVLYHVVLLNTLRRLYSHSMPLGIFLTRYLQKPLLFFSIIKGRRKVRFFSTS